MKFKQIEDVVFWWPVKIHVPDPERAGATMEIGFEAQFMLISGEAEKAILTRQSQLTTAEDQVAHQDDLLKASIQNWRKIEDDDGAPAPFSAEGLDRMLRSRPARVGLWASYFDGLSGTQRKN